MQNILITGATGRTGREVLLQLPPDVRVRAMSRNPEASGLPPQVELVRGDLTVPESLDECLGDIDTVFLVWTVGAAAIGPALERILRQARRIVYLSTPYKAPHPMTQQPNPLRLVNIEIERLIEESGREWTFLRPGMYSANARFWWSAQLRAGDRVRWPYLAAASAPIDERDIAAVAVRALCEDGHAGAEYELTGPQELNHRQQIATIGEVLGRSLRIEEMSPEEAKEELLAFFPDFIAKMLMDAWGAAMGHPAYMTSTFADITGAAPRTFRDWVTDHVGEFQRVK